MKRSRIKRLIFLSLIAGIFSPVQVFGTWDLSDTQVKEPECLNCCVRQFQDQCNSQAEESSLKSFIAHRSGIAFFSAAFTFTTLGALRASNFKAASPLLFFMPLFFKNLKQIIATVLSHRLHVTAEKPQGIILIIRAKNDWNYALSSPYLAELKKNYLVLSYTAEHISDIEDAIKSVQSRFNLPIKALVWAAHGGIFLGDYGSETQIFFGDENIDSSNIHKLVRLFALLDKECTIIVMSCLAAWGENNEVLTQGNIAQLLASVAGGRKIYASRDFTSPVLDVDPNTLVPRFNSPSSLLLSFVELFSGFMIDAEKTFDLARCYVSGPDGNVKRC
jgi:hypothetical protein